MAPPPSRTTLRQVFGIAEFRALWLAELLSVVGDQLARVALSVLVYARTGSAALTGLAFALTFLPSLLGGVLLTGLADRFPRRSVMVAVDLVRAGLILVVAVPGLPFWAICVFVGGVPLLNPPFKAAQLALLPQVLDGDRFAVGMSIRSMTVQSAQVLGFAGGGALLLLIDPRLALVIDAGTFLVSAVVVRTGVRARPAALAAPERGPFLGSLAAGSRLVVGSAAMRALVLFTWLPGLLPVYEGIAVPYVASSGGGPQAVGLLLAADPVGSVICTLAYTRWVPAGARAALIGPSTVLAAVPLVICFVQPGWEISVVLFVVSGGLGTVALLQATTALTLTVPDERRAQVLGLSNTGLTTSMGVAPLVGGVLADRLGAQQTVGLFGIAGLLGAVALSIAWQPHAAEGAARP
jgi:MFS family permease